MITEALVQAHHSPRRAGAGSPRSGPRLRPGDDHHPRRPWCFRKTPPPTRYAPELVRRLAAIANDFERAGGPGGRAVSRVPPRLPRSTFGSGASRRLGRSVTGRALATLGGTDGACMSASLGEHSK